MSAEVAGKFRRFAMPLSIAFLCALVFVAYGQSIKNGFVWDDNQQIVMNPDLRPGASITHLFSSDVWNFRGHIGGGHNYYRPLQMLTYRLTAQIWGFDPHAFHAVSIGVHLIAVLLMFTVVRRLCGRIDIAFASAALFAVHPVHTEAVDWISALTDLGCTASLLLAFFLFHVAHFDESDPAARARVHRTRVLPAALSCVAFALALLWKETAIVFPLLVMAYVFCLDESGVFTRRLRSAAGFSAWYWGIVAGYLLLRLRMLGFIAASQRNWGLSAIQFALSALSLLLGYWAKLIAPFHLNAYYVFLPVRSLADVRAVAAILFLLITLLALMQGIRRTPLLTFAGLWVFLTLLPVLDVYAVGRNVFTERYLYLPSIGFCMLAVLASARLGHWISARFRSASAIVALLAVVTLFTLQTIARNPDWKDAGTLFASTLERSPNAPFVQNMVAETERSGSGSAKFAEAESHYLWAAALAEQESPPDRLQIAFACKGLATLYADQSQFGKALQMLDHARLADPEDPEIDSEQGLIFAQAGRWPEAETALARALKAAPNNENVLNALGVVAWQHNRNLDQAAGYFLRAIAIHTDIDDFSASLHSNLGGVYGEQGRVADAIAQMKLAVNIAPHDPEYHTNLAQAYIYAGQHELARAELETALALVPGYQPARAVLEQLPGR